MHSLKPILGWSTSQFYCSSLLTQCIVTTQIFTSFSLQNRLKSTRLGGPLLWRPFQINPQLCSWIPPDHSKTLTFSWWQQAFSGKFVFLPHFPTEAWRLRLMYTTVHETHHRDWDCCSRWRTAQKYDAAATTATTLYCGSSEWCTMLFLSRTHF